MKRLLLLLFILPAVITVACAQDAVGTNKQEKKVLKLINVLPEIKAENAYRRKRGVTQMLQAYIQNTPTKTNNYYSVSITENLGFQLRTYEWYTVNAKTFEIRYWDMASDKTMSLAARRKQLAKSHKKQ